jgi:hypothetical protein
MPNRQAIPKNIAVIFVWPTGDTVFIWLFVLWSAHVVIRGLRVLRKIFGPTRDEVRGEWRKFHNEELHDLYFSPTIVLLAVLRKPLKRTPYRIGRQA